MIEILTPILLLAVATLASEDLTCIAAGQFVNAGHLDPAVALAGCMIGIFTGDVGLWMIGRHIGRRCLRFRFINRQMSQQRLDHLATCIDRHTALTVLATRFLPGTRLPTYVAAGTLGCKGTRFIAWSLVAALIWTPLIVLVVAHLGDVVARPMQAYFEGGWVILIAVAAGYGLLRMTMTLLSPIGRARFGARVSRLWQWEFWPMWAFYLPVVLWIAWLTIRYRSFRIITAANPGIPHGGFVGESKFRILLSIRSPKVSPTVLISRQEPEFDASQHGWTWPVIFKPDVGQRGAGVKRVASTVEAKAYLSSCVSSIIAQPYHPGPFEAGIFYYRFPNEPRGSILSITDKHFPELTGDGQSTIEHLIWKHPRYRMQAKTFLARHANETHRVLEHRETFPLTVAGNHCQGTLFRDGSHLLTPELEEAVDAIAKTFEGFSFGRFDVRYTNIDEFKAGRDLTVIELNGITSESTNIYDPSWTLWRAYALLFKQWSLLFRIGAANLAAGQSPSSLQSFFRDVVAYHRAPSPSPIAD